MEFSADLQKRWMHIPVREVDEQLARLFYSFSQSWVVQVTPMNEKKVSFVFGLNDGEFEVLFSAPVLSWRETVLKVFLRGEHLELTPRSPLLLREDGEQWTWSGDQPVLAVYELNGARFSRPQLLELSQRFLRDVCGQKPFDNVFLQYEEVR